MKEKIYLAANKEEEKFLRVKTAEMDLKKISKRDLQTLIMEMKKIMRAANGVGLSANQIGLPYRMFVAEVPNPDSGTKFYAVINPKIEKNSDEKEMLEEGCLSVPGKFGSVERLTRLTLRGLDRNGHALKIKAWGLLARIFQHEIDHLEGKLFIDRAKNVQEFPASGRLKKREETIKQKNVTA